MKFTASRSAVAVLAAGALVLTGCADKKSDDAATTTNTATAAASATPSGAPSVTPSVAANGLPDVQIVKDAALAIRETLSMHLSLKVDDKVKGLPVTSVDGDIVSFQQTKRVAAQGDANIAVKGEQGKYIKVKFAVVDNTLYVNTGGGKWESMGKTGEQGVYDPSIVLDQEKGLANILTSLKDAKVDKLETVNGLKAVKVTGTVSPQVLDPLLPQITKIAKDGNSGDALPTSLWIVFDPSQNPQPKPNVTRMQVHLKDGNIELNLTDFGKEVKVEKPTI